MEEKKSNAGLGLGIAGLVLGIIALIISFIPCLGMYALVPGVIAIVLSAVAFSQAKKANASMGLIIAALVISILGTVIAGVQFYLLKKGVSTVTSAVEQVKATLDSKMVEEMDHALKPLESGQPVSEADFNNFITTYENFISEAAKLKNAKNNDASTIVTLGTIAVKIVDINTKLEVAKTNLTEAQIQKFDETNKKLEKELDELKK